MTDYTKFKNEHKHFNSEMIKDEIKVRTKRLFIAHKEIDYLEVMLKNVLLKEKGYIKK